MAKAFNTYKIVGRDGDFKAVGFSSAFSPLIDLCLIPADDVPKSNPAFSGKT